MTRPNDRPVQRCPRPDVAVRSAFRAQVRHENRIACLVGRLDVRSHRGDHHIAATCAVSAASASRTAASRSTVSLRAAPLPGPAPAREHHRVGSPEVGRNIVDRGALEIDDHRFGARCFEVRSVRRVSDEAGDRVAALCEQPFEDQGDLAVSTGDDDAHVAMLRTARVLLRQAERRSLETAGDVGSFASPLPAAAAPSR